MNHTRAFKDCSAFRRRHLDGIATLLAVTCFAIHSNSAGQSANAAEPEPTPTRSVIAYLPDYRLPEFTPERLVGLTDLVLFSIEPRPTGELDTSRLEPKMIRTVVDACQAKNVRVTIALGGWDRSKGFAKMAADPAARKRFAKKLVRFCLDHQLSGADFDWEHPHDAAEERSYADLIVATKQAFRPHGLTISAALAGWQNLPAAGFEALDRVHLMAYDHDGPRHATLELVQADVKQVLGRPGMSAEKLIVGVPCYARSLNKKGQTVTYAEVVKKHRPAADIDETSGWYFNGLKTVRTKARLVRDQNLGGVMFWELGQDAAGDASLIRAASQTLSRP